MDDASTQDARSEVYNHYEEILAKDNQMTQNRGQQRKYIAEDDGSTLRNYHARAQHDDLGPVDIQQQPHEVSPEQATASQQQREVLTGDIRGKKRVIQNPHGMTLRKRRKTATPQSLTVTSTTKAKCASTPTYKIQGLEGVRFQGGTLWFSARVELSLEDIKRTQNHNAAKELVIQNFGRELWELLPSSA